MKTKRNISSLKKKLEEIKEKGNLSPQEITILNYVLSFISFRIKILSNEDAPLKEFDKLKKEEGLVLDVLSKKELKKLNQLILYKDIKRREVREVNDLKRLKSQFMSKIK
ncbi:MAG: hypothetical protein ACOCRX_07880 [Candidatus Woesearchaeota archaeon]